MPCFETTVVSVGFFYFFYRIGSVRNLAFTEVKPNKYLAVD